MLIKIDDFIGYFGIQEKEISRQLAELKSDDSLEVLINSPGGDVYEGIAIFNAIREVAKTHSVSVKVNGMAASMASYIALAARTVDKNSVLEVSCNSIFMIHNPYTIGWGDYKEFEKQANFLKQLADVLGSVYSAVSGKDKNEVAKLMDEESFYVGEEILNVGFANEFDKIVSDNASEESTETETNSETEIESRETLIVNAKMSMDKMLAKMKENVKDSNSNIEKAAALLKSNPFAELPVQNQDDTNTENIVNENGGSMTIEELKKSDKTCYDACLEEGKKLAVEKEQERVSAHLKLAGRCGAYELAASFIKEGKSISDEDVQAQYMDFAMAKKQNDDRLEDNPPAIPTPEAKVGGVDDGAIMAAFDEGFNS